MFSSINSVYVSAEGCVLRNMGEKVKFCLENLAAVVCGGCSLSRGCVGHFVEVCISYTDVLLEKEI